MCYKIQETRFLSYYTRHRAITSTKHVITSRGHFAVGFYNENLIVIFLLCNLTLREGLASFYGEKNYFFFSKRKTSNSNKG